MHSIIKKSAGSSEQSVQLKSFLLVILTMVLAIAFFAQEPAGDLQAIKLKAPNLKRGLPFMETLSVKASAREWSDRELAFEDLSDLMWAADGINRPEENKSTASSAMNAHDICIYVFMKAGIYLYNASSHELVPIRGGDFRSQIMMARPPRPAVPAVTGQSAPPPPSPSNTPIQIILVSDTDRFKMGAPELKAELGAIDAGIVSQNISLFCAATGLKTRPRASMDRAKIKELLNLKDTQHVFLNHPVGYAK